MLRIDTEASDDDSDTAINKSATTTPKKGDPNSEMGAAAAGGVAVGGGGGGGAVVGNAHAQPNHVNNVNNAIIGNAGQTPLQALPKVLPNMNPYTHYDWNATNIYT